MKHRVMTKNEENAAILCGPGREIMKETSCGLGKDTITNTSARINQEIA